MKRDIIKKYKHHRLLSNISIISASLVFALAINFLIFDGTPIGKNLKTSIVNVGGTEVNADIYLKEVSGELKLVSNKTIKDLKVLSLSLTYNPNNTSLMSVSSEKGDVSNISNADGINSLIIVFPEANDLSQGDSIISIVTEKKIDSSEQLNIVNANFSDISGESYELTTSGITF